jgi:gliding motility-associated-like protein
LSIKFNIIFFMCKQKANIFIFIFFLCISTVSFSQIVATPSAGCAPQNIQFTNPPGATGVLWIFGDGGSSPLSNPGHNYLLAGNYNVVCTATIGGVATTHTILVKINPKPVAGFNFVLPPVGCAPRTVSFTSTSTSPTTITQYQWTFGDGGSNIGNPTPIYVYTLPGTFTANLTVTDANGCSNFISQGPIIVTTPPTVIINTNPSPPIGCSSPFNCVFSGSNCVGNGLSYNWAFGNGQTSTQQNPGSITYATLGTFIVTLTVTDNNGCSAFANLPVTVTQPTLNVIVNPTVCLNQVATFSFQTNQSSLLWNMGNGVVITTPTSTNPITTFGYIYNTLGTFVQTITAGVAPCTSVVTRTVTVEQVTAAITATPPSFSCNSPFLGPYFNASSPNAVAFSWSVMSNCNSTVVTTSTLTNPTFTFTQGSLNPYTIFGYCIPTVTLVATSINGCSSTATIIADTLRRPTAWFNKNKKEGCAPLAVTFRDSSFAHTSTLSIVGYTWNNGASPPTIVSGVAPPIPQQTFTYNSPGTYTPFLTIQTVQGCIDVSFIDTVKVVNPAPISFSFSPAVVCPNQSVQIINTSPGQNTIQHWHIKSDNGFFSGCVSNPNPAWVFTHIGVHTFTLEAYKNSCKSSTTIPQTVTVKGPIVQSRFETNCTNRRDVIFATQLQDVNVASLNYGDGTPTLSIPGTLNAVVSHSVMHTYATTGNYTATVIGTNGITGTCSPYTYTMLVQVRDVQAGIVTTPTACGNINSVFSSSTSVDVLVGCGRGYTWYFDNLPPVVTTQTSVNHTFPTVGTHTVILEVKDLNSCCDTVIRTVRISTVIPNFSVSASPVCASSGSVQFTNLSTSTDPLGTYTWSFGPPGAVSNATNPIYNYTSAAVPFTIYQVTLVAFNSLGCSNQTVIPVQVNNPNAQITPLGSTNICFDPLLPFNSTITIPPGFVSYTLNFGDLSQTISTSTVPVVHSYSVGTWTASIIILDNLGCLSSASNHSLVFTVQQTPTANFNIISPAAAAPNSACLGDNTTFSSTSTPSNIGLFYNWDLGTGGPIVSNSVVVSTYTNTGVFTVSLTIFTIPSGCMAKATRTLYVGQVKGNMTVDKSIICLGQAIKFTVIDTVGVYDWVWDYSGGATQTIVANPPGPPSTSHTYTYYPSIGSGNEVVSAIFYSSQHSCSVAASQTIQIIKVNADFKRNLELSNIDWEHCIGITDQFNNSTTRVTGPSFNWNFGDGNVSNSPSPQNTYQLPGIYYVTFTVTESQNNCVGVITKKMVVNPLPTATAVARDTCQGRLFPLYGSGSPGIISNTWTPTFGVTNPNALNTTATASTTTNYTLTVTDNNGCVNSSTMHVYIQLPPKEIRWDTTIIVGEIVPINGYAGINMTYTWAPPTDLNCIYCINPISTSTNNITYSVTVSDNMGCFTSVNTYSIYVDPKSSVDVPTAFTPNGDGINDIIYVDGWGIKKLNYFRIFNRWGQLLFESNDIAVGWDGIFKGVPQNMETYVYQVSAETYIDKNALLKTGSFKLIR